MRPAFHYPSTKQRVANTIASMQATGTCSRRQFFARATFGCAALVVGKSADVPARAVEPEFPPASLFSKICQEINLNYEQTADVIAQAGLDGIDCPVRPGGQVLPARVADDLPRFAEALERRRPRVLLLTTAIKGANSPAAETILRTARALGVKYYRLGYWNYRSGTSPQKILEEIKAQLKDLAAMNKELGACALLQNHAGTDLVGAKVRDFWEIASAFSPDEIAIAFDIGHALNELPRTWKEEFDRLKSHCRVAYVKDWKRGDGFVPCGEGEIADSGFFKRFRSVQVGAPLSIHVEYDWTDGGRDKTPAALAAALRRDLRVTRGWWTE
jgi:sugar phosphate isomerase/epimerase